MVVPRRVGVWLVAALLVYAVLTVPRQAAAGTRNLLDVLAAATHNLIVFIHQMAV